MMNSRTRSRQKGVALVVGLILVAVASLGAIVAIRSSHLQDRMASNQHNKVISEMAAEAGAGRFLEWLDENKSSDLEIAWQARKPTVLPTSRNTEADFPPFGYYWLRGDPTSWTGNVEVTIIGEAWSGELLAETRLRVRGIFPPGSAGVTSTPFEYGNVGCEGVATRGSGRIDSYDSRTGSYNKNSPGREAHVLTTSPTAVVELTGNAPIYGDINSTGGVTATGSSPIYGNVNASGLVSLQGGGVKVHGNVSTTGDIIFASSAEVLGDVAANGNIAFNNWGAGVTGSAHAGGTITSSNKNKPPTQHVAGTVQEKSSPGIAPVPKTPCDPLDIGGVIAKFDSKFSTGAMNIGPYTYRDLKLSPDGVDYYDPTWNVKSWKKDNARTMANEEVFGKSVKFLKVSDFSLGQNGSLEVTGGDVVLMVDGDMSIGGNTAITIAPGSSLTVFLKGTFDLQGSVTVNNRNPIDSAGKLPFSLFSSYEQKSKKGTKDGVQIRGNTDLTAVVYAPKSHVAVTGSGDLYGQLRGKTIEATGAGGLHYDVALRDYEVQIGDAGGGEGEEPSFRVTSWDVILPD